MLQPLYEQSSANNMDGRVKAETWKTIRTYLTERRNLWSLRNKTKQAMGIHEESKNLLPSEASIQPKEEEEQCNTPVGHESWKLICDLLGQRSNTASAKSEQLIFPYRQLHMEVQDRIKKLDRMVEDETEKIKECNRGWINSVIANPLRRETHKSIEIKERDLGELKTRRDLWMRLDLDLAQLTDIPPTTLLTKSLLV